MIIPPTCFCGEPLMDKWLPYQAALVSHNEGLDKRRFKVVKPDSKMLVEDTPEFKALADVGLAGKDHICCRRMMLSHVDIIDDIN